MGVQRFSYSFLLLNLISFNVIFVSSKCLPDQKQLLLNFRDNLIYDSSFSSKLVHWNESSECCEWNGVTCDQTGRIIGLDLTSESISGGINDRSTLFSFRFLQRLNLAENYLGSIEPVKLPKGFRKLIDLRYLNLSNSGFSGQIPVEIGEMRTLVILDLSTSSFPPLELINPNLETLIQNLTRLRELYLDMVNVSAQGYTWGQAISSSLPDLHVLSLSNCYLSGPVHSSLAKLKSLSVIHLDGNPLSAPFPGFFADFPNLKVLTLSSCNLSGTTPEKLFEIPTLETIDLNRNELLEGSFSEFPVNGSLQKVRLSQTKFSGHLPESIGNLQMLLEIDLRNCNFTGPIPKSLTSLVSLVHLDFSNNHFIGSIPSLSPTGLQNLNFLHLENNSLEGEIPASVFLLPSLNVLYLSNNHFSQLQDVKNIITSPLVTLDLSSNNIQGPVPEFLLELYNLSSLSLSWNKFNGSIELSDFAKLRNLSCLDLSYNELSVITSQNISTPPVLPLFSGLFLASCKLSRISPLRNQSILKMLDLSDNQIDGEIPNWIWELGNGDLPFLNLSHNHFTHLQEPYSFGYRLSHLDLHSNKLNGQIPIPPPSIGFVDFSSNNFSSYIPPDIGNSLSRALYFSIANNKITGTIPISMCNATSLRILDLSNNSLHGAIPSCLTQKSLSLGVLNLRRNNLTGDIPEIFTESCSLETVDLSRNLLTGKVPKSLTNCTKLEVLNLGYNDLRDTFPCWLKQVSSLHVLVLRSNGFHDHIRCPGENYSWPYLQIIDLASNSFSGVVPPSFFLGLKAMAVGKKDTEVSHLHFVFAEGQQVYYQDSVIVGYKGQDRDFPKVLSILTSVDFSRNNFEGNIPDTVGQLRSIRLLNFSHNGFRGQIPRSLGDLKQLESLDLSSNKIGGRIPPELASLMFLSSLNVSHNQLVGRIPQGNQMPTFTQTSFEGNEGLCGFPLNITCDNDTTWTPSQPRISEKDTFFDDGFYISTALGFIVGLAATILPLLFSKRWRKCHDKHIRRLVESSMSKKKKRKK